MCCVRFSGRLTGLFSGVLWRTGFFRGFSGLGEGKVNAGIWKTRNALGFLFSR